MKIICDGSILIDVTNATTNSSIFFTVGTDTLTDTMKVSFKTMHFGLTARGPILDDSGDVIANDFITGNIFKIGSDVSAKVKLSLKVVKISSVHPDRSPAYSSVALISIASGELVLRTVTIRNIYLTNEAFCITKDASLTVEKSSTFSAITGVGKGEYAGSALRIDVEKKNKINIVGSSFSRCTSVVSGGALNMAFNAVGSVVLGGLQVNQEVQFHQCHTDGYGGALYVDQKAVQTLVFNRVEYRGCTAGAQLGYNVFLYSVSYDSAYAIAEMNEILKGQIASPYEFMAFNGTDENKIIIDMAQAAALYAFIIPLSPSGSSDCTCVAAGVGTASCTACNSLARSFLLATYSHVPISTVVNLDETSAFTSGNFTGTLQTTATIEGNGRTVTLAITGVLEDPLITLGPAISSTDILLTVRNLNIAVQRTDAVSLRQSLFHILNTEIQTDEEGNKHLVKSSNVHYLELNTVTFTQGNEPDEYGNVVLASTVSPLIEAQDDTYIVLYNVVFSYFKFLTNPTTQTCPSLLIAPSAYVMLRTCSFTNITLQSAPLLDVSAEEDCFGIELPTIDSLLTTSTASHFDTIIRLSGDGAILSLSMPPVDDIDDVDPVLILGNSYFHACIADDGNGGVFYLDSLDSPDLIQFKNIVFSGCSATHGNNIYIESDKLTVENVSSGWSILETDCLNNEDFILQSGTALTPVFDHSAVVHTVLVDMARGDDSGTNDGPCGFPSTVPCRTLYMANVNKKPETTHLVLAPGSYPEDIRPISFMSSITISSDAPTNSFVTKDVKTITGGVFLVSSQMTSGSVIVERITFQLVSELLQPGCTGAKESQLSSAVFQLESSDVITNLTEIAFVLKPLSNPNLLYHAPILSPVIQASVGTLNLYSVSFSSLTLGSGSSVIHSEAGVRLTLSGCQFTDITLQTRPVFTIGGVASELVLEAVEQDESSEVDEIDNVFTNIKRESGSGAVFSLTLAADLGINLQHCTFVDCISLSSENEHPYAGAIAFDVADIGGILTIDPETVSFSLTDSSFDSPSTSAISFSVAPLNGFILWSTSSVSDEGHRHAVTPDSYAGQLQAFDPLWDSTHHSWYYVYVLEEDETGDTVQLSSSTFHYAMTHHLSSATLVHVGVDAADFIGCGAGAETGETESIPCLSIEQAYSNIKIATDDTSDKTLFLDQGTHIARSATNTLIDQPITIAGYAPSQFKSFLIQSLPAFTTTALECVNFKDLSIQTTSGGFIINTGLGGISLEHMQVVGIPKAPVADRLYSTFIHSTAGPVSFTQVDMETIVLTNCSLIIVTAGELFVDQCSFTDITGHSPGTGGTVITHDVTTSCPLTILSTTFTACHTQVNGGALYIHIVTSGDITISLEDEPVDFIDCSAVGNGGAIYFEASQRWGSFTAEEFSFSGANDGDTTAYANHGVYMFYNATNKLSNVQFTDFLEAIDAFDIDYGSFEAKLTTDTEIKNMFELQSKIRIGSSDPKVATSSESSCGTDDAPCATFADAYNCDLYDESLVFQFANAEIPACTSTLIIDKAVDFLGRTDGTVHTRINISSIADVASPSSYHSINDEPTYENPLIYGITEDLWLYLTELDFLFIDTTGSGRLENVFLRFEDGDVELDTVVFCPYDLTKPFLLLNPVIDGQDGYSMSFRVTRFNDLILEDNPLLHLPTYLDEEDPDESGFHVGKLTNITNITRNHGNGAVFEYELEEGESLTIHLINFTNCVVKDGYGGVIALTYSGGSFVFGVETNYDGEEVDETIFHHCVASEGGGAVYILLDALPQEDDKFGLNNIVISSECEAPAGSVVLAEGENDLVHDVLLWDHLIRTGRHPGLYQIRATDIPDAEAEDIHELVPETIYVPPGGYSNYDENNDTCQICRSIALALKSFHGCCRYIVLLPGPSTGGAKFFSMLDHTVTMSGPGRTVSIQQYGIDFTDSRGVTWPNPVYYLCVGPTTQAVLSEFTVNLIATSQADYEANCGTGACRHLYVFQVAERAQLTLDRMQISPNKANPPKDPYNHPIVNSLDGRLIIQDTTFENIDVGATALFEVSTEAEKFIMLGQNTFNKITSPDTTYSQGLVFNVELHDGAGIKLVNADFLDCSSSSPSAGLIHLYIADEPEEGSLVLENLYFNNPSGPSATANRMSLYFILETYLNDYVTQHGELWTSLINHHGYPASTFEYRVVDEDRNSLSTLDLADEQIKRYYVSPTSSAEEDIDCSATSVCTHLNIAADYANEVNAEYVTISLTQGTFTNDLMKASFLRSMVVSGTVNDVGIQTHFHVTQEKTGSIALLGVGVSLERNVDSVVHFANISVEIESLPDAPVYVSVFAVVSQFSLTAELFLDTITFTASSSSYTSTLAKAAALTAPVIHAGAGFLRLRDTTFTDIQLSGTSLLSLNPKTIIDDSDPTSIIYNTTVDFVMEGENLFETITNHGGNGAVFSLTLKSNASVYISNVTFRSCSAVLGGDIFILVDENITNTNFDIDVSSVNFALEGTITDGTFVYIRTHDPRYAGVEFQSKYTSIVEEEPDLKHDFVIDIITEDTVTTYEMYEGFNVDEITVSDENTESSNVFTSLPSAFEAFRANPTKKRILIQKDLVVQPPSETIASKLYLNGLKSDRTRVYFPITAIDQDYSLFQLYSPTGDTTDLACNDLAFTISSTPEHVVAGPIYEVMDEDSRIYLCSSTFTLAEGSQPLTSPILLAWEGTVALTDISAFNMVLYNTSLISLPSDLDLVTMYITCTFTNITRKVGNGCIFSEQIEAADVLTLNNLQFINCTCENGYGGAVSIALRFRAGLIVENVVFDKCSSFSTSTSTSSSVNSAYHFSGDDAAGKGGAIYIQFEGLPTTFLFSDVTISNCSASEGRALFFDTTAIEPFTPAYWSTALVGVNGAKDGDIVALTSQDSELQDLRTYTEQINSSSASAEGSTKKEDEGVKPWLIVVIVVLSVLVVVAVVVIIICCRKKS